jgi:hypothetical protein
MQTRIYSTQTIDERNDEGMYFLTRPSIKTVNRGADAQTDQGLVQT